MTDGSVAFGPDGATFKRFDVRDGQAIRMARNSGLKVGLISGRSDAGTLRRAEELELDFAHTGASEINHNSSNTVQIDLKSIRIDS